MIVLVCGGRNYDNAGLVRARLAQLPAGSIVIEGGAPGADRLARQAAEALGFHVAEVSALWGSFGRSAGHRRNEAMLTLRPELVIAFPGGPGTANCVFQARRRRIPVEEVR